MSTCELLTWGLRGSATAPHIFREAFLFFVKSRTHNACQIKPREGASWKSGPVYGFIGVRATRYGYANASKMAGGLPVYG